MEDVSGVTEVRLARGRLQDRIPDELFACVLSWLECTCLARAEVVAPALIQEEAWRQLCRREALRLVDGVAPRAIARRAFLCDHRSATSEAFAWRYDERDGATCECVRCGRAYGVAMALDYIDTKLFSSKLVTRCEMRALHPAPARQRRWSAVWDAKQAAAAKAELSRRGFVVAPFRRSRASGGGPRPPWYAAEAARLRGVENARRVAEGASEDSDDD